jgi:hypothetical protein
MQKLMKMLEDVMVAITFAEAGEFDEAIGSLPTSCHRKKR